MKKSKHLVRLCSVHGMSKHFKRKDAKDSYRCWKCAGDAVSRRRQKLKQMAVEYKGGQCKVCKYDKCVAALTFHHLDPEQKEFGIADKGHTRSWDRVKNELDKCILLCHNCHAEEHSMINKMLPFLK